MSIDIEHIEESRTILKCLICHIIIATGIERKYEASVICTHCFRRYITT